MYAGCGLAPTCVTRDPTAALIGGELVDRAAHGNEKGPRWRAFLTVGDATLELAYAGGVTVVRAELSPILLVEDE